jgi:hypothetical protein
MAQSGAIQQQSQRRVHPLNLEAGDEAKKVVPAAI